MKLTKFLALLLAAVLALSFTACNGKTPDTQPSGGDTPTPDTNKTYLYNLAEYSVVYSNQVANRTADAITAMAGKITDGTGVELIPQIDRITEATDKEILVGSTDRPESEEALALITNDDTFVIKTIGSKIVINAKSDALLITAVNYFSKLAAKQSYGFDEISYVSDPVSTLEIVSGGKSEFKIVHLDGLDTSLVGGNEKYDWEVKLGYDLSAKIKTAASVTLDVVDDGTDREYEILIGRTSREESNSFFYSLALNEYGYEVIGNKIVILGTNSTTLKQAVDLFVESVNAFTKNGTLTLCDGMRITRRSTSWNLDFPSYDGGVFGGTLDSTQKGFTVLYKETNPTEFEAYCQKLEAEGYTLYQRHDIENNLHATYTHEKRGMVHTYYTASEESVRIITYKKGSYNLPTHTEKYSYEYVTKTSITQFGLYGYGEVGLCCVVTLEDGSFIVIDGGTIDSDQTLHHEFYALLKDLNKRPDGKIVIKAWYLTHEHSDHYQMFSYFMNDYGSQITIDEFWCNTTSANYAYNGSIGSFTWTTSHSKYASKVNGDFKWINLHTGMEFYAANMKFEVLYTEEDLFPKVCQSYNNCILIMKMTDIRSGQTMLWMGDLLKVGCETLANNYENYLKSDILQVAHHAKSEALPVYQEVLPTVAIFPCDSYTTTGQYGATNRFLRDNVPVHIKANGTYTIYLPYKEGTSPEKWTH